MSLKTSFGLLGKPAEPAPQPTLEQVLKRLAMVEARLNLLELNHAEDHLLTSQHRRALVDMHQALQQNLTEAPYKFTAEQQRVWDDSAKKLNYK